MVELIAHACICVVCDQECRSICVARNRSAARALAANRADNRACAVVINTTQKRRKKRVYEHDAQAQRSGQRTARGTNRRRSAQSTSPVISTYNSTKVQHAARRAAVTADSSELD